MIIWRRFGFLVFLSIGLAFASWFLLTNLIYGDVTTTNSDTVNQEFNQVIMFAFWLPAFYNFIFERLFCRNEKSEVLYNVKNEPVEINNYSRFFFIRNKYWTYILLIGYGIASIIIFLKQF
ncbi:hypothetical protein [Streptococcus iniae]|uniref:Uncharacterized protein n=1 Tax=Streptococcus iniae TaxID=1346 RepID=A0A3L8FS30_STRIN|nr:hypothetical protein [Streptococcus iniae]AJG25250.1 hypothetical protein SI82_01130 [Streptococcus iniae]ATX38974.1 hypothetical protein CTW00_00773 [Streptococcus iniae]EKB52339.1 hypothetical protein A0G_0174 [Streptococcus iniae 9117]ELY5750236.1 hypothetical protein [Streptococcus iniae]ELY5752211.1 hypothetical protein [Streptococcus iniae]